jgi:hypothetical protein
MIVQSAPEGSPRFVITQVDHARACGDMAQYFGNKTFAAPMPYHEMVYMVAHHDEGWQHLDDHAERDPNTGFPYHLTQTPILKLVDTGAGSPDHNEAFHPYSGLLSSMHTWGLYHGRYGLSNFVFIDRFPAEHRPKVDAMLAHEEARQARLKAQLAHTDLAEWTDGAKLMHNYKLLQFFDTLGLYFHTTHPTLRGEQTFANVPRNVGDDVTLTLKPLGENYYHLSPFPFSSDITMTTRGRWLSPLPDDADVPHVLSQTPFTEETVVIVEDAR